MSVQLLPRLVPSQAERLLSQISAQAHDSLRHAVAEGQQTAVTYGASGGQRVAHSVMAKLQADMIGIARGCGYPDRGDKRSKACFDRAAARALALHPALQSGEALRNDFWAHMAVLLWRVSLWRFPPKNGQVDRDHLLGGVRNVFQRLWLRGKALDRGPAAGEQRWDLLDALSEDALVQITERPSVGGNARLAKLIAEEWVRASTHLGREKMEDVMRLAVKRIRLRNEILVLAVLPDGELTALVRANLERAASDLKLG